MTPNISVGDTLTFRVGIISDGGTMLHNIGDKVTIREIIKTGGFYGKISGYWIEEKIIGFLFEEIYGQFSPSCFIETNKL